MKILIAEDDFTSRLLLKGFLKTYGSVHIAINGRQAVESVRTALDEGEPYELICLDIMMPEMDGQEALAQIRSLEEAKGIPSYQGMKIIMTTALEDIETVSTAFNGLCDGYLVKPIQKARLLEELHNLKLIS